MALWVWITIGAAFAQNLRFMLQKHLRAGALSTAGATFARFVFVWPIAAFLAFALWRHAPEALPPLTMRFWAFVMLGGLSQILATACVVALFAQRNFTVGIAFKKTEVVQAAALGLLILGDEISLNGLLAILVGLIGVILLSDPPERSRGAWHKRIFNAAAGLGLLSGALFGLSGIAYRGAVLSLSTGDFAQRAMLTLAFVMAFQTFVMVLYLYRFERGEITRVLSVWRIAGALGIFGLIGSSLWFMAFSLQNVSYVKAVGQIELVFTFLASYLVFKERANPRELTGIALVVVSILVLILWH